MHRNLIIAASLLLTSASLPAQSAQPLGADVAAGRPLPLHIGGRVVRTEDPVGYRRQWPGTYIEGAFQGQAVDLGVGPGAVSLRIRVDDGAPIPLVRPAPGLYRIAAKGAGRHRIRVDVASESQDGATELRGLFAPTGTTPLPAPRPRARQIEFIGDSHTVGYGNTATSRQCSRDVIWRTTDTTLGPAGVMAARYGADYRVNAISGRGVVRNYGGFAAPTLPQAYPFALFDGHSPAAPQDWHPQLVVMALGTNDFSTALKAGEPWPNRDALHADYERTYRDFIGTLRRRYPQAFLILWATDMADGEIAREVDTVVTQLQAQGEHRIAFVPVNGLGFKGCDAHPDTTDDRRIAAAIGRVIDARPDIWKRTKAIRKRPVSPAP
ncbi:SGNH/GDSL hydrolase family protein [Sphingomonas fuzhouensis]|uniref:SGNH/GDSL hydrolase family protein n=1 Tax=Sphingomonas fuzhouensis TaxID=3106033 RepID=UPI002AFEF299|nr:GDSL-type esterase/lipase family protein [Sphingomonas sp. SGZ-02]